MSAVPRVTTSHTVKQNYSHTQQRSWHDRWSREQGQPKDPPPNEPEMWDMAHTRVLGAHSQYQNTTNSASGSSSMPSPPRPIS